MKKNKITDAKLPNLNDIKSSIVNINDTKIPTIPKKESLHIVDETGKKKRMLYEPDEEFESCCFKCDKPLCLYIGKFSISVAVLLFCMFMLQNKDNSAEFYTGTIAGLLGHYLNSPISQLGNQKKKKEE